MTSELAGEVGNADAPRSEEELSLLRGLLRLSTLMSQELDERTILNLSMCAVPTLGPFRAAGVQLDGTWIPLEESAGISEDENELVAAIAPLGPGGGPLQLKKWRWSFAFALTIAGGFSGFLVVCAPRRPAKHETFLIEGLAHQTALALANARLNHQDRRGAEELAAVVMALQQSMEIHERLTRVAIAGEGPQGIAEALFELTGYSTVIEDSRGNLTAWAGLGAPPEHPRDSHRPPKEVLERAMRDGRTFRYRGRLIAVARPREDLVGLLALLDPEGTAGTAEQLALEHGATVLAMDLARLHSLAETQSRRGRDLLGELLAGADDRHAQAMAQLLGYDLSRPHRVVVFESPWGARGEQALLDAARRAAEALRAGSLLAVRSGTVVLLADAEVPWEELRAAAAERLGTPGCRAGVGGRCDDVADFRRSYREAQLALKMQKSTGGKQAATLFDDLGIYQVLCEVEDLASVERLVRRWLWRLLDYDARARAELV
ncbi:MAG: sugar diacid utilization regulator, partial [Acidimicrobiaceae bacterium]|nr:sugar diacid utilization regulator [Acidimicrobiaceae bacterium]